MRILTIKKLRTFINIDTGLGRGNAVPSVSSNQKDYLKNSTKILHLISTNRRVTPEGGSGRIH